MKHAKKVNKPWGYEIWINDGSSSPYALKKIFLKAGSRTSLQVHKFKNETNYILSGIGKMYLSKEKFDIDNFLSNGIKTDELLKYESELKEIELYKDVSIEINSGYVHRVIAITDIEFIEVSTTELDDVIRIQDDNSRPHGKIDVEHNQ